MTKTVTALVLLRLARQLLAGFDLQDFRARLVATEEDQRLDLAGWLASKSLRSLGSGSARDVWALDNRRVLKTARNDEGIVQNLHEIRLSADFPRAPLAHVRDSSEDGLWLVADRAVLVTSEEAFVDLVGYDSRDLAETLADMQRSTLSQYPQILQDLWVLIRTGRLGLRDATDVKHWGSIQGRPVLVDYGL